MVKTLSKHGNSYALIIDKPILELLNIDPEQPLDVSTDGRTLTITPVTRAQRAARIDQSLKKVNKKHGKALKKLAE